MIRKERVMVHGHAIRVLKRLNLSTRELRKHRFNTKCWCEIEITGFYGIIGKMKETREKLLRALCNQNQNCPTCFYPSNVEEHNRANRKHNNEEHANEDRYSIVTMAEGAQWIGY